MSSAFLPDAPGLATAGALAYSAARSRRWRPGLAAPDHSEVFSRSNEGSGAAAALALARDGLRARHPGTAPECEDRRHVLWVQDRSAIRLGGRPYRHGLPEELRHRLIHVEAKSAEDALFALEEGLRCRDLAFVIGEVAGNPRALDFTASRRLSLAAEKHGVPLWLVRLDAEADLSSARMRWRVEAAPSPQPAWNRDAPGTPTWQAELFRARSHPPGQWVLGYGDGDSDNAQSAALIARREGTGTTGEAAQAHYALRAAGNDDEPAGASGVHPPCGAIFARSATPLGAVHG